VGYGFPTKTTSPFLFTAPPTVLPTPSVSPSLSPTVLPTVPPSVNRFPSSEPTSKQSRTPSSNTSSRSLARPTNQPSSTPSAEPSSRPTTHPSSAPTRQPFSAPSATTSGIPLSRPSSRPTHQPSSQPTRFPTSRPSYRPTVRPSSSPTRQPFCLPTSRPSGRPTGQPTNRPSLHFPNNNNNRGTRTPTFSPTVATTTQIEGAMTLSNIQLSALTEAETKVLTESLRDGIAATANINASSVTDLTLTASSSSSTTTTVINVVRDEKMAKKSNMRTSLATVQSAVLVHFIIVELSSNLNNALFRSPESNPQLGNCLGSDSSSHSLVDTFRAILSCNNGAAFLTEFRTAIQNNLDQSNLSLLQFQTLLKQANSTGFVGLITVDQSPTSPPTPSPSNKEGDESTNPSSGATPFYIIIPIAGFMLLAAVAAVSFCVYRNRKHLPVHVTTAVE
jgi:hypothetical protein